MWLGEEGEGEEGEDLAFEGGASPGGLAPQKEPKGQNSRSPSHQALKCSSLKALLVTQN